jgi:Tol biopolymer transport system component
MGGVSPTARGAFPGNRGKIVFFGTAPGAQIDIWKMGGGGANRVQLTDNSDFESDPAFSPNGELIVYERLNNIWIMNANGSDEHAITATGTGYEDFSWINNTKILYIPENESDVHTIGVTGANDTTVKLTPANESEPDWSKARQRIVFIRQVGPDSEIFTMKLDGSGVRRLTDNNQYLQEDDPDWAPDGSRIAFQRWESGGTGDIFTIKPNGSGIKRLTDHGADDEEPAFSPDKRFIAFETTRRGIDDEIWRMRADGSQETKLTDNQDSEDNPDWQPLH